MPRRVTPVLQRLPETISPALDRSRTVTISFDGERIEGYSGDTVGSAVYGSGVRLFSRSFKYHRPRGLLCCRGACPNCLVTVDGTPNVRACVTPAIEGMVVKSQNAFPSLDFDALSVVDKFDKLLPVGFYYKTMMYPRSLWPLYETVLRNIAGLGKVDFNKSAETQYVHRHLHPDVAVIGGGPAGLSAAITAARTGGRVVLVDENAGLGGHLRGEVRRYDSAGEFSGQRGHYIASELIRRTNDLPALQVLTGATAVGLYEGNLVAVAQGETLVELRAGSIVVAAGIADHPLIFQGNDLPGVMLGSAVQRMMQLWAIKPAQRAVVISAHDEGLQVAADLLQAGVTIAAVAEHRTELPESDDLHRLLEAGVPVLRGWSICRTIGSRAVEGAVLSPVDESGQPSTGRERQEECSLVVLSTGLETNASLLWQAGCTVEYDDALGLFTPRSLSPGVFVAGAVTGIRGLESALVGGQLAGHDAAAYVNHRAMSVGTSVVAAPSGVQPLNDSSVWAGGHVGPHPTGPQSAANAVRVDDLRARLQELAERFRRQAATRHVPVITSRGGKKIICPCEDVTLKDIKQAIREGFDHIETLKRYSTVTMGPCQGKMCAMNAVAACARETGKSIAVTGTTTSRPLVQPVSLGAIAGPHFEPARLTPMHPRHIQAGAEMMDAGQWKRPRLYTSIEDEVRAVRERVGLIDVSTLGKLDVQGPGAVRLLERVYTNKWADLRVGRVRYGVMVDEAGIILDDGTVARLAEQQYFVTTTSSGVAAIEEWLNWWMEGASIEAHVTNLTSGLAAVNLAGPRARDVLAKLVDFDISAQGLPYLRAVRAQVAGIPAIILRIGFVGELGYEMHVPAEYGEYFWDAVMTAGEEFGIAPFGVEAQRTLRLEKGHIIVTQDTDALSNPLEADMAWVVKLDKPDFIGSTSLSHMRDAGPRQKLVGFKMLASGLLPEEGAQIVSADGYPVGRVTSVRRSPVVGAVIGLAWVPIEQSEVGAKLAIQHDGDRALAEVVPVPFYDPSGARMRS